MQVFLQTQKTIDREKLYSDLLTQTGSKNRQKLAFLIRENKLFIDFYQGSADGMIMSDEEGIIYYCNQTITNWLQKDYESIIGLHPAEVFRYDPRIKELSDRIRLELTNSGKSRFEWEFLTPNGEKFWVEVISNALRDNKGRFYASSNVLREIGERKALEQHLESLASTDALTGCLNRRFFMESAEKRLHEAQRYGYSMSILLMDLDYFKKVNDQFGHLAGDFVLREKTKLVNLSLRESDLYGRYGGEEFIILLSHANSSSTKAVAERLRKTIEQAEFKFQSDTIPVTTSIGGCCVKSPKNPDVKMSKIIEIADQQLYKAKEDGRNLTRVNYID